MEDTDVEAAVTVSYSPEEDKFLMLKRSQDRELFPGKWEFAGGEKEANDISSEALRELKEETGMVGEAIKEGDSFDVQHKHRVIKIHPVLVIIDYEKPDLSREHTDFRWVGLEDIEYLETVKGIRQDLVNVGVVDE